MRILNPTQAPPENPDRAKVALQQKANRVQKLLLLEPSFWAIRTLNPTQALPDNLNREKVSLQQKRLHKRKRF